MINNNTIKNIPAKNLFIDILTRDAYITFRRKGRLYYVCCELLSISEGLFFDPDNFECFYVPRKEEDFFYMEIEGTGTKTYNKNVIKLAKEKITDLNDIFQEISLKDTIIGGYYPELGEPLHFVDYYGKYYGER